MTSFAAPDKQTDVADAAHPASSRGRVRMLLVDRTVWTLLAAAGLILAIALLRPSSLSARSPQWYWTAKVAADTPASIILAGDSRTYRGLSPRAVAAAMHSRHDAASTAQQVNAASVADQQPTIINFGFGGLGYSDAYLRELEARLDPHASRRIIVLGITPNSLTDAAARKNGYTNAREQLDQQVWPFAIERWLERFRPTTFNELISLIRNPDAVPRYHQIYHADGWVASDQSPRNPQKALPLYRSMFARQKASPACIDRLLAAVASWRARGIEVYAHRPAATPEMDALENDLSGFDEQSFIRAFEQAGGQWIDPPRTGYDSYDGSHLCADSARQWSAAIGRFIAAHPQHMLPMIAEGNNPDTPPHDRVADHANSTDEYVAARSEGQSISIAP